MNMDKDFETVYIARNQLSAELIRNALLNEKITTKIKEPDNTSIMKIYYSSSFFAQEILDHSKDVEKAKAVIARMGL